MDRNTISFISKTEQDHSGSSRMNISLVQMLLFQNGASRMCPLFIHSTLDGELSFTGIAIDPSQKWRPKIQIKLKLKIIPALERAPLL